ncbi:glycine zipper domain-containing protein [Commensalibacter nepenthis]|uniref:Glycine zipper domain-containing protein n=1 Tax=Commensalibacter nepenthis TaxID=3043872 RepID=A0ABT6Q582_9PROT|nr:glycine zipper domain-containing protein [Commensalibacter sp. TBRC 10068]MDI2111907.1 glycine zipper domain-containing protein [Commensalibacter sp. TBRC 10068]
MFRSNFYKVITVGTACFMLSACSATYNSNLTPEQNKQNQRDAQYNNTLGTGAVAGTALGALVGGLVGGKKGLLIGSLSGAAVGTGAGYMVADRTQNQQMTEDQLNKQIATAHQITLTAQADAQQAAQQVDAAQRQLATLNQQIASKKITKAQYQQKLAKIQQTSNNLNSKINYYSEQSRQMHQYATLSKDPRFAQEAQQTDDAINRLKYAENLLVTGMGAQPAGYNQTRG